MDPTTHRTMSERSYHRAISVLMKLELIMQSTGHDDTVTKPSANALGFGFTSYYHIPIEVGV